jgi:hypothetical protein
VYITQSDLDKFVKKNPIIRQLLFSKFLTLCAITEVFPCDGWDKEEWLDSVIDTLANSVVLSKINLSWVRGHVLGSIFDTFCNHTACDYTGFFICPNRTLVEIEPGIRNNPLGMIIMRNVTAEDNFHIKCGESVPRANEIVYGEIIASNPDLKELGLGKVLLGATVLYFQQLQRKAAVLSIAHGLSNTAAYSLYTSFGFIPEDIHIGPEEYGSTLASVISYPIKKLNQYTSLYSLPKMIWCMNPDSVDKTISSLERELAKPTYRDSTRLRLLPSPRTEVFETVVGQIYWQLVHQFISGKKHYRKLARDYTMPEFKYTDEYYSKQELDRKRREKRNERVGHLVRLGKTVLHWNNQRTMVGK